MNTQTATAAKFSWTQAPDLMDRLTYVQNHWSNANQDIVTFAGWCSSREELEKHVIRYEEYAAQKDAVKASPKRKAA